MDKVPLTCVPLVVLACLFGFVVGYRYAYLTSTAEQALRHCLRQLEICELPDDRPALPPTFNFSP